MPQPISGQQTWGFPQQVTQDQFPVPLPMLEAPEGIAPDSTPRARMNANQAISIVNCRIGDMGRLQQRDGTVGVGASSGDWILGVFTFVKSDGTEIPILVSETGVQVYDPILGWQDCTGTALIGDHTVAFAVGAAWGEDHFLFTNGINKIVDVDVNALTFAEIAASPVCLGISTFGNRLIASRVSGFPARIQWSIKDDNTDWTSAGSGFEDLAANPGTNTDIQVGIYPVNDTFAIVLRSGSVWGMSPTGLVDTPFSFGRLFSNIGCPYPYSPALVDGGVVFVANDDVYIVTQTAYKAIGAAIKTTIANNTLGLTPLTVTAAYSLRRNEYVLCANGAVYVAKIDGFRWTTCNYICRNIMLPAFSTLAPSSLYLVSNSANHSVIKEELGYYLDANNVTFQPPTEPNSSEIIISNLPIDNIYDSTVDIVEIQIDYISETVGGISIAIFETTGVSRGSSVDIVDTNGAVRTISFRYVNQFNVYDIDKIVISCGLGKVTFVAFRPYVLKGARRQF